MTLLGGTFVFPDGGVVALTGSDFGALLKDPAGDGVPIEMYTACEIRPGQILKTGPSRSGARCYLCVRGGIAVKPLLGSASTHILTGLGGFEGRALRKGDILAIGDVAHDPTRGGEADRALMRAVSTLVSTPPAQRKTLRTTIAPQTDFFSADSLRRFYESSYTVTEESNRMGLRLQGPAVEVQTETHGQMTSEGVSLGAIQIPAGGQPIILFVEQQTTGGYPKIANIISADLPSVGQLRPRDQIRFEPVTPEIARALIREQEVLISQCTSPQIPPHT
jgi:antagonist of KipI